LEFCCNFSCGQHPSSHFEPSELMYVPERRFHPAVTDLPITGYPLLPHPIRLNRIAVSGRYRLRKPSRRSRDPYAIYKYSRRSIASLHDNAFR